MLPKGKRALTGTYFAEQVAKECYDLICVAHADQQSRPSTQQSQVGSSRSRNGGQSTPANSRSRKRTGVIPDGLKNSLLPTLGNIDLLLDDTSEASATARNLKRDELRDRRQKRINEIVSRLCPGDVSTPRAEEAVTATDSDVVHRLTKPLPHCNQKGANNTIKNVGLRFRQPQQRKHITYQEAVQAGLAGTEFGDRFHSRSPRSPMRGIPTRRQRPATSSSTPRSASTYDTLSNLICTDVRVVPESATEAYFNEEIMAQADQMVVPEAEGMPTNFDDVKATTPRTVKRSTDSDTEDRKSLLTPSRQLDDIHQPSEADAAVGVIGEKTAEGDQVDPHANILEAVGYSSKMSKMRREASQSLRMFLFGSITDSKKVLTAKDIDRVLRDRIGSREQVKMLHGLWNNLDDDRSGYVDITEFRTFVEQAMKDIIAAKSERRQTTAPCFSMAVFEHGTLDENRKFGQKLCDRVGHALLGMKTTFVLEDMMRIIWPCCTASDMKTMKAWCNEIELTAWRAPTPRHLSSEEFDALAAVFRYFDNDGSGSVTVEELVGSGLMDKEQAHACVMDAGGADEDAELSMLKFCEMFCPTGFRAHSKAKVGTDQKGRRLVYDERLKGWRPEDKDPAAAGLLL
eukprot:TRINITY_DN34557_c0_g1_i1.p1 TRINITY_DN34557_c0_g1~~TRINITY_DN34557_c0_g1_i1.p1  ORF type:complete len:629 (+),score=98.81 TRINITY_DN34557_c0_g1_i1:76-1962(+)